MLWLGIVCISFISTCFQRLERLTELMSFLGLGYLAGTPNLVYDRDAFVYMQNYIYGTDYFESGYNWLTKLFEPRMDYQTFRLYSSLIVFLLMFLAIFLMTKHVSAVALFYAIGIFPVDKLQVRNCMGAVFILFGAFMLIQFRKKGVLPSLLVIFAGSFFHSLALYFLLLPVVWFFKDFVEKHFSIIISSLVVTAFVFEILGSTNLTPVLVQLLGRFGNRANVAENVSTVYSGGGLTFVQWFVFCAITIFAVMAVQLFKRFCHEDMKPYYQIALCALVLWAAALTLMTLSIDYIRVLRIVAFFYFIYIANVMLNQKGNIRFSGIVVGVVSAIVLMLVGFWSYGFTADQIRSIFGFI